MGTLIASGISLILRPLLAIYCVRLACKSRFYNQDVIITCFILPNVKYAKLINKDLFMYDPVRP